ncbi:MAG: glutathione S-transferase family protein [Pseudomonadota bacterium]
MTNTEKLELLGAPGSPYTRKMLALLRYRQIPHRILWGGHQDPPKGYPSPKVRLLPTFYFQASDGTLEAAVDSTPITRRLETDHEGRSVIPADPELAFYNDLIEDYADEWLTKAMFHYRWYHEVDRKNAGPLLIYWSVNTASKDMAEATAQAFTKRQYDRLYVVGSNDVTAQTIEESYARFIRILDGLIAIRGYVLGARPSSADFAIYGQLTQLGIIEPTSAKLMTDLSFRVRAWLDRMEDLSGLDPDEDDWFTPAEARTALKPLLGEIGRVYAPFLLGNAAAAAAGNDTVNTEIDSRAWTQPTFPYQAKCLMALRNVFNALPDDTRSDILETLSDTGCETLFVN